jgi:uncharacterized protein
LNKRPGFCASATAQHPLDASAVHPESYELVDRMAKDLNCSVKDLMRDAGLRQKIQLPKYVTETVGLPTLTTFSASWPSPAAIRARSLKCFPSNPA